MSKLTERIKEEVKSQLMTPGLGVPDVRPDRDAVIVDQRAEIKHKDEVIQTLQAVITDLEEVVQKQDKDIGELEDKLADAEQLKAVLKHFLRD